MKRLFVAVAGAVTILLVTVYVYGLTSTSSAIPATDKPIETSSIKVQSTEEPRSYTFNDIAQTGRPQFLNAYATWCPYCQQNDPIVYGLQKEFQDRVDFIHLNVDTPGVLEAAAPYTITGVTQYVLIDADGTIIEKWFGTIREDDLAESITSFLNSM